MLRWQAGIRRAIQKVDPTRTVFIMCRGGGEGVGTASLAPFGSLDHMALDWHDYFNGALGRLRRGRRQLGAVVVRHPQPGDPAATPAPRQAQARVLQVPLDRARAVGHPAARRRVGRPHRRAGQRHLPVADARRSSRKEGVSWTRWVLATGGGFALLNDDDTPTPEASQLAASMHATASALARPPRRRDGSARRRRGAQRAAEQRQLDAVAERPQKRGVAGGPDHDADDERRQGRADRQRAAASRARRSRGTRSRPRPGTRGRTGAP